MGVAVGVASTFSLPLSHIHTLQGNVSNVIDNIKTAFKERLSANDWLDPTTKARCMDKVDAITKQVAYPDQVFNNTYLNLLYKNVSLNK